MGNRRTTLGCREWKLVAVGLALLCGACNGSFQTVSVAPSPTAVPAGPAAVPSATPLPTTALAPTIVAEPSCSLVEPSPSPYCDREMLLAARDALRGTNTDALRTWQRDRPLGSFEGVRVDPSSGRVVALELHYNRLAGLIPPELGQLGQLGGLHLDANDLTGRLPPELGQLALMDELHLDHNRLTGAVPIELDQHPSLVSLQLLGNQLTGCIPPSLARRCQCPDLPPRT